MLPARGALRALAFRFRPCLLLVMWKRYHSNVVAAPALNPINNHPLSAALEMHEEP